MTYFSFHPKHKRNHNILSSIFFILGSWFVKPVQRIEKYPNSNNFEIFSTMYVTFNLNNFIGKKKEIFSRSCSSRLLLARLLSSRSLKIWCKHDFERQNSQSIRSQFSVPVKQCCHKTNSICWIIRSKESINLLSHVVLFHKQPDSSQTLVFGFCF